MSKPRVFLSYATGDDGLPVTSNNPSYYRVVNGDSGRPVEFWSGGIWNPSYMPNDWMLLDDILGSGATVRELLDPEEWPDA